MKKHLIVPKDTVNETLELHDVATWYHSHGAFTFVMTNGSTRVYPDTHIWYVYSEDLPSK